VADDLELGFAGSGWIASVHGLAVEQVPGLRVTRVASRDPQRAAAAAARVGARACAYDELPDGVPGVVICTPPAVHAAQALAYVEAGAAVLVEKPLCTTLVEADALVAATERGARIAYAENLVHAPIVQLALEQRAPIGPLDQLEVRALQDRPSWGSFLTEAWGGGVLFDLGVHPLAVALLLAAPARPTAVRAELGGADDHPVDEHAELDLRFDTGLVARVVASWRGGDTPVWDAQASSPTGVVRIELLPDLRLERDGHTVALPGLPEGVPPQLEELGYLRQIESFALDLRDGRAPELGPAFGRSILDVTCAAYHSAATNRSWVQLPFAGPRDRTPLQLWKDRADP